MQKRKHLASIEERLDQKDRVQKENTKLLLEKSRDSVVVSTCTYSIFLDIAHSK